MENMMNKPMVSPASMMPTQSNPAMNAAMNAPMVAPMAVAPAYDNAKVHGMKYPVSPAFEHPCGGSEVGMVLVLFILLVIILRGAKFI
ncbi:hypothetical protein [Paenibacillus koleovorans]|uniref:hypothetical protein n=1 Tax=Paenibacillus koleovorans TaxID=121608 RepID=UPI000FDA960D|nr:hypothetical protein [Paenibacillus koleovorans]